MAPAPKDEHVPTLTSVSTAKGNIPNEIVLGTDKPNSLNKTGHNPNQGAVNLQALSSNADESYQIITPIKADRLSDYLEGYNPDLKIFLTHGFTFAFKIPYTGQRGFRLSKNLSSLQGQEGILMQRLQQKSKAKRIAGPFAAPLFQTFKFPL